MNIEKMKKQLQINKFENLKMELQIKHAERLQDAERIDKQIIENTGIIKSLQAEHDSMGE